MDLFHVIIEFLLIYISLVTEENDK